MILRTKSGDMMRADGLSLLEYLGVREVAGVQMVSADVELIASVQMKNEQLEMSNEQMGVAWTFSTFDLDRYGERVDPAGWDFSRFALNPVIEWAHRYDIPAIGRAEGLYADDNGLHGVIVFNDKEYDPFGWSIGERVKAGVIRAGSVGFRVMEIEIPSKADSLDGTSLIFRKQELLEFSICNVPANPWALAKEKRGMRKEKLGNFTADYWGGLIQMSNEHYGNKAMGL